MSAGLLAASIICKNEERALPVSLESVREAVSEIVISDTGSTDSTYETAYQWLRQWIGARPAVDLEGRYFVWEHRGKRAVLTNVGAWWDDAARFSFSKARNFAACHLTRDWYLSLDCDEVLVEDAADALYQALGALPPHVRMATLNMEMCDDDDEGQHIFAAERLIRRGAWFRDDMHNWVDVRPDERAHLEGTFFRHTRKHRSHEARRLREEQRHAIAERFYRERLVTDPKDRRALFYLATDLMGRGTHEAREEACELFYRYLQVSPFEAERFQAALYLSRCLLMMGKKDDARRVMLAGREAAWYRAEAPLLLGDIAMERNDTTEALHWYREAARMTYPPYDPMFLENEAYTFRPWERLGRLYQTLGQDSKAEKFGRVALRKGAHHTDVAELGDLGWREPHEGQRRMAVFVDRGQMDFIEPLLAYWGSSDRGDQEWEIRVTAENAHISELLRWADVAWFEWAGPLLIRAAQERHQCRMIARVHGYELHAGHLQNIYWPHVDDVVFTAYYLMNEARKQCRELSRCRLYMVPGGVSLERYHLRERRKQGNKVAMAAYLNYKKNLPLAVQVFALAKERRPELELHVAGEWQDSRVHMYFGQICHKLGIADCTHLHDFQKDLDAFYADKDYYLSSSMEESFHYTCMEAMACGLKPVVHCWVSAEDYYPADTIFTTVEQGAAMLCEPRGSGYKWRRWVEDKFSFDRQRMRLERILARPRIHVPVRDDAPWHIEHRIKEALTELGCRPSEAKKADLVLATDPRMLPEANGAKKVFWNAEQVLGESEHAKSRRETLAPALAWADRVFSSHPQAGKALNLNGSYAGAVYLGGAHPKLMPPGQVERNLNWGFCGLVTDRRAKVLTKLNRALEGELRFIQTYDPQEMAAFYHACKVVVNPHCTAEPNVETRIAEALACGAVVFTEPLPTGHPFAGAPGIHASKRAWHKLTKAELRREAEKALMLAESDFGKDARVWVHSHLRLEQQVEKVLDRSL